MNQSMDADDSNDGGGSNIPANNILPATTGTGGFYLQTSINFLS